MTTIEWCERTWNPVVGCSPVSEGCKNCYAARMAQRLARMPLQRARYGGLVHRKTGHFNGTVRFSPNELDRPGRWNKPSVIFVCSMGDLFHPCVGWEPVTDIFATMWKLGRHTFCVLTKRPEWMFHAFNADIVGFPPDTMQHVWLGVSVENQEWANERISHLAKLHEKGYRTFISCEPLLDEIDLTRTAGGFDAVIVGGESGPGARFSNPYWISNIVADCRHMRVPVFVKQLGCNSLWEMKHPKGGNPEEWPQWLRTRDDIWRVNTRKVDHE